MHSYATYATCVRVHSCGCVYWSVYLSVCACVRVCMRLYHAIDGVVHQFILKHTHTHAHTRTHPHAHTLSHIYTHTHTHTHTHNADIAELDSSSQPPPSAPSIVFSVSFLSLSPHLPLSQTHRHTTTHTHIYTHTHILIHTRQKPANEAVHRGGASMLKRLSHIAYECVMSRMKTICHVNTNESYHI